MNNTPHWATGLTKLEIAEQVLPVLILNFEHDRAHTDGEILEMVEVFNDMCLDEANDLTTIQVLNQYVIPHQNHITIELIPAHIEFIHTYIDDWVCEYAEKGRSD